MTREEREALLEAETPDLPDHSSPYRAGARRLIGIVIVSLVISAAVSLTLILTLTSGLSERIKRDVLAELQREEGEAKAEQPKRAVFAYVPEHCSEPLSSDLADHVALSASTDVLARAVGDEKIRDTAWYAKHADAPKEALARSLRTTAKHKARVLAFHGNELPEADREAVLSSVAAAYVAVCREKVRPVVVARQTETQSQEQTTSDRLDALEARYLERSRKGLVQLGPVGMLQRIWTEVAYDGYRDGTLLKHAAGTPWEENAKDGVEQLLKRRVKELEQDARREREDLEGAETLRQQCLLARRRLGELRLRRALGQARSAAADPSLPAVLRGGRLTAVSEVLKQARREAVLAALHVELQARWRQLEDAQDLLKKATAEATAIVAEPILDLAVMRRRVERQGRIVVKCEYDLAGAEARMNYLQGSPSAPPHSRPASAAAEEPRTAQEIPMNAAARVVTLRKQVQSERDELEDCVDDFATMWQKHRTREQARGKAADALRRVDAINGRIRQIDVEISALQAQVGLDP